MRSFLIILALIGVAVVGVMLALSARQPPKVEKRAEPVLAVRTFRPAIGKHAPALFLIGKVEARDYATLTAPIDADVLKMDMREGDFFRANQRLLLLDLRDLTLTAQQQESNLTQLETNLQALARNKKNDEKRLQETRQLLQLAQTNYDRDKTLLDKGVVSPVQLEISEQTLLQRQLEVTALTNKVADYATQQQNLQASIISAQATLNQTELLIERADMRAPFAGRVARVHTAVGAHPARGAPLLDIFDPAKLRLRVAIPQRYVTAIKAQKDIRALLDDGDNTLTLNFSGLEPQIAAGNSSVNTFFNLPAGDWILGAVRDITVELPLIDATPIPADALYKDQFIYRIDDDDRAEALTCKTRGLTKQTGRVDVLVSCPELRENDRIIANHLPNLLGGIKLTVVAEQ